MIEKFNGIFYLILFLQTVFVIKFGIPKGVMQHTEGQTFANNQTEH